MFGSILFGSVCLASLTAAPLVPPEPPEPPTTTGVLTLDNLSTAACILTDEANPVVSVRMNVKAKGRLKTQCQAPDAPTLDSSTCDTFTIAIPVSVANEAKRFRLYGKKSGAAAYTQLYEELNPVPGTSYTYAHTPVDRNVDYLYYISQLFDLPCSWKSSSVLTVSIDEPVLTLDIVADKATIDYDAGDTGVTIHYTTANATSATLTEVTPDGETAHVLTPNTTGSMTFTGRAMECTYRLDAVNDCDTETKEVTVSVVCPTPAAPVVEEGFPEYENGSIKVTYALPATPWDTVNRPLVTLFRVDEGGDIELESKQYTGTDTTVFVDTTVNPATEYCYYVVVAYSDTCENTSATDCAVPLTVAGCGSPVDATVSVDANTIYRYRGEDSTYLNMECTACVAVTVTTVNANGTWTQTVTAAKTLLPNLFSDSVVTVSITPTDLQCPTYVHTETIEVVTEPEPQVTLDIVTSPMCPDDSSYLAWSVTEALPGTVKISGPMFTGEVVLNGAGQTSGVIPITVREGTRAQNEFGTWTYELTWTLTAYYSDGSVADTASATGCFGPKVDSFSINGDSVGPVEVLPGENVSLDWTTVNCEDVYITDEYGTTSYDASTLGTVKTYTQSQTITIGCYETPCRGTCNTKSINIVVPCVWPTATEADGRPLGWPVQLKVNGIDNITYGTSVIDQGLPTEREVTCPEWNACPDDENPCGDQDPDSYQCADDSYVSDHLGEGSPGAGDFEAAPDWDGTLTWSQTDNMYVAGTDFIIPYKFKGMVLQAAFFDPFANYDRGQLVIMWATQGGHWCYNTCFPEWDTFAVVGNPVDNCPFSDIPMTGNYTAYVEDFETYVFPLGGVEGQATLNITAVNPTPPT